MSKYNIKKIGGFKEEIEQKIEDPLDDEEIREYLPDAKILTYKQLSKYQNINQLLPDPIDYAIILYLDEPNKGHWTAILKYDNKFEMFDPYGIKTLDQQLNWVPCTMRIKLGVSVPYITRLFNSIKKPQKGILSTFEYQDDKDNVNTCGRHVVYRILKMLNDKMDIEEYYKHMKKLRKEFNLTYDEIVSTNITPDIK